MGGVPVARSDRTVASGPPRKRTRTKAEQVVSRIMCESEKGDRAEFNQVMAACRA
jgi:hypothetical protein